MRSSKTLEIIEPHYFKQGEYHVCMFCMNPLASLKDGKLTPLGNKAHVEASMPNGGTFVFNCCKSCVGSVQSMARKDEEFLSSIYTTTQTLASEIIAEVGNTELATKVKNSADNPPSLEFKTIHKKNKAYEMKKEKPSDASPPKASDKRKAKKDKKKD